ncbi:MAG TPA: PAS domain-containing sensor histidine kinase, partial [Nitrospirae bacterium]|nr:PAS domain-containing sensor histidine kinase [Nitrospirota bacterium]
MIKCAIDKISKMKSWRLVFIIIFFAEILTAVMNIMMSHIVWQRISVERIGIGALNAFVVSLILAPIFIYLVRYSERIRFEKESLSDEIAKRIAVEHALRESVKRHLTLLEIIPYGIEENDLSGTIIFSNPAHHKMLGYNYGEFLGEKIWDLQSSESDRDELRTYYQHLVREQPQPAPFFTRSRTKDGRIIDLRVDWDYRRDDYGKLTGFISVITDITEQKKSEEMLVKAKEDWEDCFNTINEAITIHDMDFNIIRANRAAEELLGLPLLSIKKQKCFKSYHGTECPPNRCPRCLSLKSGKPSVMEIFEPYMNRFIEIKVLPRLDKDNNIIGLIHVVKDVTEQKKLQNQLRQSQKMEVVGQLAGGIAHDFNNILTAIMGFSYVLQQKMDDNDPEKRNVENILASAERASNLIKSLLAFSRKQIMNPVPAGINDIIENIKRLLASLIGEDIEIKIMLSDEDMTINADIGQIEQVLLNLATNARDAMPEGGTLAIRTQSQEFTGKDVGTHGFGQPGRYAVIEVADTGMGMDRDTMEKIFEPFFTTKESGRGTGLGLAMVYGIIRQHNGYVHVYSEPGQGTTFRIHLPLIKTIRPADNEKRKETETPRGGIETILLAEDDELVRMISKSILQDSGYKVIEAVDGEDALMKFSENMENVDLLISDVIMPKKNGVDMWKQALIMKPDVKCLFMSGYPGG